MFTLRWPLQTRITTKKQMPFCSKLTLFIEMFTRRTRALHAADSTQYRDQVGTSLNFHSTQRRTVGAWRSAYHHVRPLWR